MKVKVSFTYYKFETKGLVKLGRFSGENLTISSWWSSLSEKLAVSGRMDFVTDIVTDTKREMKQKNLGMPFPFLSLS